MFFEIVVKIGRYIFVWTTIKGQKLHVELPHFQSQQQTLSAASRVEQA
jgi:hypothetical protein